MDLRSLVVPQPSMLNTSSAQANAAKRVLRFTAEYLHKEIFGIVAASVTPDKVTKVMALHGGRVCPFAHSRMVGPRKYGKILCSSTISACPKNRLNNRQNERPNRFPVLRPPRSLIERRHRRRCQHHCRPCRLPSFVSVKNLERPSAIFHRCGSC